MLGSTFLMCLKFNIRSKAQQNDEGGKLSSVNGCYHGHEGSFYWTVEGDYLHINISAKISEDDWVALGLSDDRKMGEDDVIAVYKNISIKSFSAASLLDPHEYSSTVFQEVSSIVTSSVTYSEGVVLANITKSIPLSYPFKTLDRTPIYLFFGRGPIRTDNTERPIYMHYKNPTCSSDPVFLYKKVRNCISDESNPHSLLKLHGILMIFAWLNLVPLTVFIARYGKDLFERPSLWFLLHKWGGFLSGLVVIISVGVAYGALRELEFEFHQTVGVLVVLLLVFHVVLALFRPPHETRFRRVWEFSHRASAILLLIGSFVNNINGLDKMEVNSICYVVIALQLLVICVILIALENPEFAGSFMNKACLCFKACPSIYYVLNVGGTPSKPSLVKLGLWTIVISDLVVDVVVIIALIYS
ncbi:hypothetical protein ACHWQZ_G007499 [Mnemiopsis leidyi]